MDNKVLLLHKSKYKALILVISIGMVLLSILMILESFAAVPATGSIVLHQTPRKEIVNEDGVYKEIDVYTDKQAYRYIQLYKIFDASISQDSSGNTTGVSYTYKGSAEKIQMINDGGFFTVDGRGYVTVNDSAKDENNASALSEAAVNWLKENADKIGTSIGQWEKISESGHSITDRFYMDGLTCYRISNDNEHTVSWTGIPLGYYFLSSNVGTAIEVTSAAPTIDIYDKNTGPRLEKKITKLTDADSMDHSTDIEEENGHGTGASEVRADHVGTVQIGDAVEYEVHITAEPGAENYLFYDYMLDGLTLDPDSVRIYLGENELASENHYELIASDKTMEIQMIMSNQLRLRYGPEEGYQLIKEYVDMYPNWSFGENNNKCHIFVLFDQSFLDTIKEEKDIYIRYKCTVNSKAVIAYDDIGNENIQSANGTYNDVNLFFGHNSYVNASKLTDRDRLYSARIVVYKYEGGSSSSSSSSSAGGGRPLNGVRFILRRKDGKYLQQDPVTFVNKWVENQADATGFVSGAAYNNRGNYRNTYTPRGGNGFLIIDGLSNGDYTLIETDPLPGYNSAEPLKITINNQHNTRKELQKQVNVANKIGSILPSTGGTGLIGIYAAGVFLTMASLTGLVKRRRRTA